MVCYTPKGQGEVTIRSGFDGGVDDSMFAEDGDKIVDNRAIKSSHSLLTRSRKSDDRVSHEQQESDDNEEIREKNFKKQLREVKWENQKLKRKAELNKALNEFFTERRESENSSENWKERGVAIVLAVAGVLGAYFGSDAC